MKKRADSIGDAIRLHVESRIARDEPIVQEVGPCRGVSRKFPSFNWACRDHGSSFVEPRFFSAPLSVTFVASVVKCFLGCGRYKHQVDPLATRGRNRFAAGCLAVGIMLSIGSQHRNRGHRMVLDVAGDESGAEFDGGRGNQGIAKFRSVTSPIGSQHISSGKGNFFG